MKKISKPLFMLLCAGFLMGTTPSFSQTPNAGSNSTTEQDSRSSSSTDYSKYGLFGLVGLLGLLGLRRNNDVHHDVNGRR